MTKILTRATVASAHESYAFCNQCGAATNLAFSDNFFMKSGFDTATGMPIRGIEAVCSKNKKHRQLLDWGYLDALERQ
jgi:hypothetical protein